MNISKVSTINFCSNKSTFVNNTTKKVKKDLVDYSRSAYSVPTGELPLNRPKAKQYPYLPYDKNITTKEVAQPEQEIADFVSESSIL